MTVSAYFAEVLIEDVYDLIKGFIDSLILRLEAVWSRPWHDYDSRRSIEYLVNDGKQYGKQLWKANKRALVRVRATNIACIARKLRNLHAMVSILRNLPTPSMQWWAYCAICLPLRRAPGGLIRPLILILVYEVFIFISLRVAVWQHALNSVPTLASQMCDITVVDSLTVCIREIGRVLLTVTTRPKGDH